MEERSSVSIAIVGLITIIIFILFIWLAYYLIVTYLPNGDEDFGVGCMALALVGSVVVIILGIAITASMISDNEELKKSNLETNFKFDINEGKLDVGSADRFVISNRFQPFIRYQLDPTAKPVKSINNIYAFSDGTILTSSRVSRDKILWTCRQWEIEPKNIIHGDCHNPFVHNLDSSCIIEGKRITAEDKPCQLIDKPNLNWINECDLKQD